MQKEVSQEHCARDGECGFENEHQTPDEASAALDRLAEREQRRQEMRPYAIVLAIIMFIVFIAMIGNKNSRYSSPGRSVSVEVGDGQLTMNEHGDMWVQKPDGTRRNPTDEERQRGGELGSLLVGH